EHVGAGQDDGARRGDLAARLDPDAARAVVVTVGGQDDGRAGAGGLQPRPDDDVARRGDVDGALESQRRVEHDVQGRAVRAVEGDAAGPQEQRRVDGDVAGDGEPAAAAGLRVDGLIDRQQTAGREGDAAAGARAAGGDAGGAADRADR